MDIKRTAKEFLTGLCLLLATSCGTSNISSGTDKTPSEDIRTYKKVPHHSPDYKGMLLEISGAPRLSWFYPTNLELFGGRRDDEVYADIDLSTFCSVEENDDGTYTFIPYDKSNMRTLAALYVEITDCDKEQITVKGIYNEKGQIEPHFFIIKGKEHKIN